MRRLDRARYRRTQLGICSREKEGHRTVQITYARVLLVFVVVPIVLLAIALRRRLERAHLVGLGAILAIVYATTSPWDNVAVMRGYWSFDRARTWGVYIGWLPLEEYLFFGLQTVLAALVLVALLARERRRA